MADTTAMDMYWQEPDPVDWALTDKWVQDAVVAGPSQPLCCGRQYGKRHARTDWRTLADAEGDEVHLAI